MTDPKRKFTGPVHLGQTIDQRIKNQRSEPDLRHGLGTPSVASQSSGSSPGGGGGSGSGGPASPEQYVSTLRLTASGTKREGDIVLDHSGPGSISEDTTGSDRRYTWNAKSLESVSSLPGSPDTATIYHLTTADTLHWHDGSNWKQLVLSGDPLFTPLAAKSAAYTATAADGVLLCSGTWTLSLPAASDCTGLHLWVRNTGSGTITIDPDSSEQIDGNSTLDLSAGSSVHIVCDGSGWWSLASQ